MIIGGIFSNDFKEIINIDGLYANHLITVIQDETGLLLSL